MYFNYKEALCKGTDTNEKTGAMNVTNSRAVDEDLVPETDEMQSDEELVVLDHVKAKWEREQLEMVEKVIIQDVDSWARKRVTDSNVADHPSIRPLQYIGGLDISFRVGDNVNACATFVVLNFPGLEVVYEDTSMIKLTAPYIPGYLAFREAEFLVEKIRRLQTTKPAFTPQVIINDGNGILHPRKYGIACHLGVLTGIPQVGAAKNLFAVRGIKKDEEFERKIGSLKKAGDTFAIPDENNEILAFALKAHDGCKNPIYVSPGHNICASTAAWVTTLCCKYRVPEPTRQADQRSREYLRNNFPTEKQIQQKKQPHKKSKTFENNSKERHQHQSSSTSESRYS